MKTLIKISSLLIVTTVFFIACQKEVSWNKEIPTASVGLLSLMPMAIALGLLFPGTYFKDTAIKASNYVDVMYRLILLVHIQFSGYS
jgi:hypothetical protein